MGIGRKCKLMKTEIQSFSTAMRGVCMVVLLEGDAANGLDTIHRTLDTGSDPRQFGRQVVDYLRNLLLVRMGNASQVDATAELRAQIARHAQGFDVPGLLKIIKPFN